MANSYVGVAGISTLDPSKPKENFRSLPSENLCDGVQFSIPCKVVETVSNLFDNTLYGYFIGKRVAFPIVEYYVHNNWGKFGSTRIMMNSKGFFFFKFKTTKGLDDVLENGPWMILNSHIILKKWTMSTRLCKEEFTRIPVWVKIHDVSLQVFSEDGINIIASHIGKPIMLDSYTNGSYRVSITPPTQEKANDRFQTVSKKKKMGKSKTTTSGQLGVQLVKQNVRYEPKAAKSMPNTRASNVGNTSKSNPSYVSSMSKTQPLKASFLTSSSRRSPIIEKGGNITMSNSYASLDDESEEEIENVYDESANLFNSTKTGESSSTFTVVAG
ncbi:zinc knuckle CX2CX4HX4C containing protein [Tanacetum coccineum]|uniref:Zinc knuckle CX2CX4HX4C containing protein n=1 Tax=Tanacetum coccineum TaxID=301880 RepID=A0ABQ5I4N7_9ASTR